jgi:GNAT superfamily N-acetyltransferase
MIRRAKPEDLAAMTRVRTSVRENHLSVEGIAALGITPETTMAGMRAGHYGSWLAEEADETIAFAMADRRVGSIFALFVLPDREGRGHGTALLARCEEFLARCGLPEAWLTTGRDTNAAAFYARHGWIANGTDPNDALSVIFRKRL